MLRALLVTVILLIDAGPAAASVLNRLQGGLNIERDQIAQISNKDLEHMHDMGIRSLRLFLWPKLRGEWNYLKPGKPLDPSHNPEIQTVGHFITRAVARDLAVIVVPFGGAGYKPPKDPSELAMVIGWMEEFAAYAEFHWDPGWVFIETWNEPNLDDTKEWYEIESQLIAAVRRKAPEFTVIATPNKWSSRKELLKITPHKDKKVIYDIHFYDPMEYTTQGMSWHSDYLKKQCNNPYPGTKNYNAERILAELRDAATWAKENKVRVVIGEFGVANKCTTPDQKAAWLRDVRKAADSYGMGWLVWEYNKAFALAEVDDNGRFAFKSEFVEALGWKKVER